MSGTPHTTATFGAAVKAARKERGWSQTELGQRAGVSRPTIARIEQGKDGHTNMLDKVAAALDLTVSIRPEH
ncbi:helix-turn-helix domain-containing protein [Achromobacter spanius]|uniref:helix-turn-helix domain-containing protein n=1 Tax=Achromobacter spanius TaxID=217203 RepID=UPI0036F0F55B